MHVHINEIAVNQLFDSFLSIFLALICMCTLKQSNIYIYIYFFSSGEYIYQVKNTCAHYRNKSSVFENLWKHKGIFTTSEGTVPWPKFSLGITISAGINPCSESDRTKT